MHDLLYFSALTGVDARMESGGDMLLQLFFYIGLPLFWLLLVQFFVSVCKFQLSASIRFQDYLIKYAFNFIQFKT